MDNFSYRIGARGYLVAALQGRLGVADDGVFGKYTQLAVQQLQARCGLPVTGAAGEQEFDAAGERWPSEFERAMNLVCNFEGTSFGDCNRIDIDGAGLTLGIAGFTSRHGEVQELLARYLAEAPAAVQHLPGFASQALLSLFARRATAGEWAWLFYAANGKVRSHLRTAFSAWGQDPVMRRLQLEMARQRFWQKALKSAESLGLKSLRARVFLLDVAVQNGGWRTAHQKVAQKMDDWHNGNETQKLVVGARAVAACAKVRWRNDVLSRKMAIATGRGVVHGRLWHLEDHAL